MRKYITILVEKSWTVVPSIQYGSGKGRDLSKPGTKVLRARCNRSYPFPDSLCTVLISTLSVFDREGGMICTSSASMAVAQAAYLLVPSKGG